MKNGVLSWKSDRTPTDLSRNRVKLPKLMVKLVQIRWFDQTLINFDRNGIRMGSCAPLHRTKNKEEKRV